MSRVEPPVYGHLRRLARYIMGAFGAVSFLLIVVGISSKSSFPYAELLVPLGASGLGACIGLWLGNVLNLSALQRVTDLVEKTLSSSLPAPDHELQPFRREWHHYIWKRFDQKPIWRYRKIDFSGKSVPGKLVTSFTVLDPRPAHSPHTYSIEAFVVRPRLIFVQTPPAGSAELAIIHVYPDAGEQYRSTHAGLALLETWDGDKLTVPVLMCANPIDFGPEHQRHPSEGTLPENTYARLDGIWKTEAVQVGLKFGQAAGAQGAS